MAGTVDPKELAAEIGRASLYKLVTQSAGMNMMERTFEQALTDLKVKEQFDGMAKEVEGIPEGEKLAEVLSRFIVVIVMQSKPEFQPTILWQLYTHLRATKLLDAVKPNVGSIVDLAGRRIPPKEGT